MKKTRIGFAILKVCQGAKDPIFLNKEYFETSEVVDPRFVWDIVNKQTTKKVRFIKQVEGGTFLVSSIQLDDRDNDNYSIWVYFPQGIEISKDELLTIINLVDSYLDNRKRPVDELQAQASKEYTAHLAEDIPSSSETGLAYVDCIGEDNLYKYLGDGRSQSSYENVRAVILKEEGVELKKEAEHVKDFSNSPVIEKYAFLEPDRELLGTTDDKYSLYIVDEEGKKKKFPEVLFVEKRAKVHLRLERNNFEAKEFDINVTEHEQKCTWSNSEWEKIFRYSDFTISVEQTKGTAKNVSIIINDKIVDQNIGVRLTENVAKKVPIRIVADECDEYSQTVNLLSETRFTLQRKVKDYSWDVRFIDNSVGAIKINSRKIFLTNQSPIEWFVMGDEDTLQFDSNKLYKEKQKSLLIGLGIGAALVCIVAGLHHFNVDRNCINAISNIFNYL